jgi:hypothetical protein
MSECAALADPAIKVTVEPVFEKGAVMARVFTSALVDLRVHAEIPEVSLGEQAP